MTRVLQLYNILGAPSERVWLEVPLRLAATGRFEMTAAYEALSPDCPQLVWPLVELPRVQVWPPSGASLEEAALEQMDVIARSEEHPARPEVSQGFSLVHGHTGPRLLHAAPFLVAGKPTILSLYGYDASRLLRDPAWPARYRWAAARGATFVVLCASMRETLLAHGLPATSIRLIRLGLDLPLWPFRPQAAPSVPRFLFVGRLAHKKGVATLLHAAALLRPKFPFTLDVVGSGPLESDLKSLAASLDLGEAVRFLGSLPREALADVMPQYTAFVLPSQTAPDGDAEGTPLVLMEAQALGLPCVTTRHAGNPDVLPPGSPFVVPEADAAALAAAMGSMATLAAPERSRLQAEARAHVESHFDIAETARHYAALYDDLISRAS